LHAAWSYHQGLLPYRDFFEHHMPGIYYLLSAVMRGYDIPHNLNDAIAVMFAARTMSWLFAGVALVFTFLLGTRYGGKSVGWLSTAFLSLSVVFVGRSLEIRPDVPATAFWVISQWALVTALAQDDDPRRNRLWWALGGLMLGATLLFTQKALLTGPGFAVFSAFYVMTRDHARTALSKIVDLVIFVTASAIPLLGMLAYFWAHGAVHPLIESVLLGNLGWVQEVTARSTLRWMLLRDPLLCAFATAGFVIAAFRIVRDRQQSYSRAAMFLPTASLFAGMGMIPTPYPQYLLPILPAAAIYAADFLRSALSGSSGRERSRIDQIEWGFAVAAFLLAATLGLAIAQPFFRHVAIYPIVGIVAIACVLALVRRRQIDYACAVVMTAISTYSAQQLVWMAGLSNAEALSQMKAIQSTTTPADRVMDGFTGVGWFRPHASFYWIAAPGVRSHIPAEEKSRMVAMLGGCGDGPRIVILDDYLKELSPDVVDVVAAHYRPTAAPPVWLRAGGCEPPSPEVNKSATKSPPIR
jgi:4-amino-4-deoxy-L-arabinose transferase-like glycosyltransferase